MSLFRTLEMLNVRFPHCNHKCVNRPVSTSRNLTTDEPYPFILDEP